MSSDTRQTTYQAVALMTDDTSPLIDISKHAWGAIAIVAGNTAVTLTYYVKINGVLYPAYDAAGVAVTQTVQASRAYPIPSAVFGAAVIQIRGDAAGAVVITLKS